MLQLRVLSLREHAGIFGFGDHLEQSADFDDMLAVDDEPTTAEGSVPRAWASWVSQLSAPVRDDDPPEEAALPDESASAGEWVVHVPLPPSGKFLGEEASIRLTVKGRRSADDSSYHVKPPKPQRP